MKAFKKTVCAALCLAMVFALCACGSQTNDKAKKTNENDNNRIANPVHESSAEEFKAAGIVMPEIDGKTPVYTTIDGDETLYQADYGTFTIRAQKTDEQKDISGMNYEWTELVCRHDGGRERGHPEEPVLQDRRAESRRRRLSLKLKKALYKRRCKW